jgi:hypothetical protein
VSGIIQIVWKSSVLLLIRKRAAASDQNEKAPANAEPFAKRQDRSGYLSAVLTLV